MPELEEKVDPNDPRVKKLVYAMYREMLANHGQPHTKEIIKSGGAQPPPPPPMASGATPSARLQSEIGPRDKGPPSALAGAMLKDKKPFTYTPGGIDLSEIKSPRMAKRLQMNAAAEGVTNTPKPSGAPQLVGPMPPASMAAMHPKIAISVFPQQGTPTTLHRTAKPQDYTDGSAYEDRCGGGNTRGNGEPPPPPPPPPHPLQLPSQDQRPRSPQMNKDAMLAELLSRRPPVEAVDEQYTPRPQPTQQRAWTPPPQQRPQQQRPMTPPQADQVMPPQQPPPSPSTQYIQMMRAPPPPQMQPMSLPKENGQMEERMSGMGSIYIPPISSSQPPQVNSPTQRTNTKAQAASQNLGSIYIPPIDPAPVPQTTTSPPSTAGTPGSGRTPQLNKAPTPWMNSYNKMASKQAESPPYVNPANTPWGAMTAPQGARTIPISMGEDQIMQQAAPQQLQMQAPPPPPQMNPHQARANAAQHLGRVIPIQIQRQQSLKEETLHETQQTQQKLLQQQQMGWPRTIPIQIEGRGTPPSPAEPTPTQSKSMRMIGKVAENDLMQYGYGHEQWVDPMTPSYHEAEEEPRFRGGHIPSKAFKVLQQTLPPADAQIAHPPPPTHYHSTQDQGPVMHNIPIRMMATTPTPQSPPSSSSPLPPSEQRATSPKKYMGSNIPSRSFKMLQAMTNDPSLAIEQENFSERSCSPSFDPSSWYYWWWYVSCYWQGYDMSGYEYPATQWDQAPSPLPQIVVDESFGNNWVGQASTEEEYVPTPPEEAEEEEEEEEISCNTPMIEEPETEDSDAATLVDECMSPSSLLIEECLSSSSSEAIRKNNKLLSTIEEVTELSTSRGSPYSNNIEEEEEEDEEEEEESEDEDVSSVIENKSSFTESNSKREDESTSSSSSEDEEDEEDDEEKENAVVVRLPLTLSFSKTKSYKDITTVLVGEWDVKSQEKAQEKEVVVEEKISSEEEEEEEEEIQEQEVSFTLSLEEPLKKEEEEEEDEPVVSFTISLSRQHSKEEKSPEPQKKILDFWGTINSKEEKEEAPPPQDFWTIISEKEEVKITPTPTSRCPSFNKIGMSWDTEFNFWDKSFTKLETRRYNNFEISEDYESDSGMKSDSGQRHRERVRHKRHTHRRTNKLPKGLPKSKQIIQTIAYQRSVSEDVTNDFWSQDDKHYDKVQTEEDKKEEEIETDDFWKTGEGIVETEKDITPNYWEWLSDDKPQKLFQIEDKKDEEEEELTQPEQTEIVEFDEEEEEEDKTNDKSSAIEIVDEEYYEEEEDKTEDKPEEFSCGWSYWDELENRNNFTEEFPQEVEESTSNPTEKRFSDETCSDESSSATTAKSVLILETSDQKAEEASEESAATAVGLTPPSEEEVIELPIQTIPESIKLTPQISSEDRLSRAESLLWRIERFLHESLNLGSEGGDSGVLTDSSSRPISDADTDPDDTPPPPIPPPPTDFLRERPRNISVTMREQAASNSARLRPSRRERPQSLIIESTTVVEELRVRSASAERRRYQRAKTHSRLFQLLQDESTIRDDEEEFFDCEPLPPLQKIPIQTPLQVDTERRSRLLPLPLKSVLNNFSDSNSSPSGSSGVLSPTSPQARDQLLSDIIHEFHLRHNKERTDERRKFPSKIFKLLHEEFGEEFYQTFDCVGELLSPRDLLSGCFQTPQEFLEVPLPPVPPRRRDFTKPKPKVAFK